MIEKIINKDIHPKILSASNFFANYGLEFYSELLNYSKLIEDPKCPLAGMNVGSFGMNLYYNKEVFDYWNQIYVNFALIHENFHFISEHVSRTMTRNHNTANIVQDMIINTCIQRDIIANGNEKFVGIPVVEKWFVDREIAKFKITDPATIAKMYERVGQTMCYFIPKEYTGEENFEALYEWMMKQKEDMEKSKKEQDKKNQKNDKNGNEQGQGEKGKEKGQGKGQGQQGDGEQGNEQGEGQGNGSNSNGQGGEGNSEADGQGQGNSYPNPNGLSENYGQNAKDGVEQIGAKEIIENIIEEEKNGGKGYKFDEHMPDDIDPELREQIVQDVLETMKARGLVGSNIEALIKQLRPRKKDYLKEIKKALSFVIGNKKHFTWQRDSRKDVPTKGWKKYKTKMNCILDTSGSMGGSFEKVLAYLYQNNIEITLLQIDTEVKSIEKIKSKYKLESLKIHGLGGTVLQPAVNTVKNKYNQYPTVILTDGYTDTLDFSGIKNKVLILTTGQKVETKNGRLVKQILIEQDVK